MSQWQTCWELRFFSSYAPYGHRQIAEMPCLIAGRTDIRVFYLPRLDIPRPASIRQEYVPLSHPQSIGVISFDDGVWSDPAVIKKERKKIAEQRSRGVSAKNSRLNK